MSRATNYNCDRCGKALSMNERFFFEVSVRNDEKYKMQRITTFDLCEDCKKKVLGAVTDEIESKTKLIKSKKR